MDVFIAGMPRSGSTFAFNIVRELLMKRGTVYAKPTDSLAAVKAAAGDADHVIMKAHGADEETIAAIADKKLLTICTIRPPEDAIASWIEAFDPDLDKAIAFFRTWYEFYSRISNCCLTIAYDIIETNPLAAACAIGRYAVPAASEADLAIIADRHGKATVFARTLILARDTPGVQVRPLSYFEADTLYHRRHVASIEQRPATARIGAAAVERIKAEFPHHAIR